jgi:hypothetical protein
VLEGPWSVAANGLTWADLLALSDVLFEHQLAKMPDEHLGEELGQPDAPTAVFPFAPAVTERLGEIDENEAYLAAIEWSSPWPGRPPMELHWALEIIGGLTTLASVLLEDQQLYLWTTSEEFTQTPEAGARSVTTTSGVPWFWSTRLKKRRAARRSRRFDTYTSMIRPSSFTARYTYRETPETLT